MTKLWSRKSEVEARGALDDTYPVPLVVLLVMTLLIGDVAVTLSAVAAQG